MAERYDSVPRHLGAVWLGKAEEFALMMQVAAAQGWYDAAVILAVHTGISAADALTASRLGLRYNGQRHAGVLGLLERIPGIDAKKSRQLGELLDLKSDAEYRPVRMSSQQATRAVEQAKRFLGWVRSQVARE